LKCREPREDLATCSGELLEVLIRAMSLIDPQRYRDRQDERSCLIARPAAKKAGGREDYIIG